MDEKIIEVMDDAENPDNNQSEKEEPEIKVSSLDTRACYNLSFQITC